MKILAIDAGVSTGYALVDLTGYVEKYGVCLFNDLVPVIDEIIKQGNELTIIVEDALIHVSGGKLADDLKAVAKLIDLIAPAALHVKANQWKNYYNGVDATFFKKIRHLHLSNHEKDAIKICAWYIRAKLAVSFFSLHNTAMTNV